MKKLISIKHLLIGLAMFCSAGLAVAMKPTIIFADKNEKIDLEVIIPKQFNDWRQEDMVSHLVNPEEQAAISKIYAQTLSRSYINAKGERVMLSIAYGKDQSDSVGVHLPEGCYGGQGFAIQGNIQGFLKTTFGEIPAARLIATKGDRIEPITYWITVGEQAVYDGWDMKKVKLKYALKGIVPDGLLMRVSSITPDINYGYTLQNRFAEDLLATLSPSQRIRLMGYRDKE
ncbi:MAG TPA: EpsI family protein [Methylotenera sp.]|nr:EpsI family protein [Methylotenera sp.]